MSTCIVKTKDLADAVAKAQLFLDRKQKTASGGNIELSAIEDGLRLIAADLDRVYVTHIDAEPNPDFCVVVNAENLRNILRMSTDVLVALTARQTMLDVSLGGAQIGIPIRVTQDQFRDELPLLDHDDMVSFSITADRLADALNRVAFAMSSEKTRYYLNGAFLHIADDQLRLVGCDGHRLSIATLPCPDGLNYVPPTIIPAKTVQILQRILKTVDDDTEVTVSANAKIASVQVGGHDLVESRLVDGIYPDYARVFPHVVHKALVDPARLIRAVDTCTAVQGRDRAVRLEFSADQISVSAKGEDGGISTVACPAEVPGLAAGMSFVSGYNQTYLKDILKRIVGRAEFGVSDPGAPALIRDTATPGATFIVMPMRVAAHTPAAVAERDDTRDAPADDKAALDDAA